MQLIVNEARRRAAISTKCR